MNLATRIRFLRVALVLFGLIFLVGVYPLLYGLVAGWMAVATESTRIRANDPWDLRDSGRVFLHHCFAESVRKIAASFVDLPSGRASSAHGGIMAVQAMNMPAEHGHLLGDVPALVLVAVVLAILMPRGIAPESAKAIA